MYPSARFLTAFIFSLAVLALSGQVSFAAKSKLEEQYQKARKDYYSLLASSNKMSSRENWLSVAGGFSRIARSYPTSSRAPEALYNSGLVYEKMYSRFSIHSDSVSAIEAFDKVSRMRGQSLAKSAARHVDDLKYLQRKNASKPRYASTPAKKPVKLEKYAHPSVGASQGQVEVTEIKRYSRKGYSRYIIYLSGKTSFKSDRLVEPDRVFVDFKNTSIGRNVPSHASFKSGLVSSLRFGKSSGNSRIVFDLNSNPFHSITPLAKPYRLVIDFGLSPQRQPQQSSSQLASAPESSQPPPSGFSHKPAINEYPTGAIRTIVIDPGHGGKDPGAIGPTGLREKDVTLALAHRLAEKLRKRLGCKVILTRSNDKYLELDERTVIANSLNAGLFISLHANASKNRRARGMETYFLSPSRSQDELETAARENMMANFSEDPAENDIAYIMSDMSSAQKINDSVMLARYVQKEMVVGASSYARTKDNGVKQAMFYVLWRAVMPSILVETNFISNRSEERLLRNRKYLDKVAESIALGVHRYANSNKLAMK